MTTGRFNCEHCAICGAPIEEWQFASHYPNYVCQACNRRAVNVNGAVPEHDSWGDWGDNPVFIDGHKCWRRYKFGGHIAMRDDDDCPDLRTFYERHGL